MRHTIDLLKFSEDPHHCSSIAFGNVSSMYSDTIIACYHGRECTDHQRVHVYVYNQTKSTKYHLDLEPKTGNPIVWNQDGKVFIFYSRFADINKDGNPVEMKRGPVERWQYCENFLAELAMEDEKLKLKNVEKIDDAFGLLARCQPITINGKTLIPLYREKDPICEIWEYDNGLKKRSEFGGDSQHLMEQYNFSIHYLGDGVAIQPTLVEIKGTLYAFCRNVCRGANDKKKAWTTHSIDNGFTWQPLKASGIPNHNNSLIAIDRDGKDCYFVLNLDPGRSDIFLYDSRTKGQISLATPIVSDYKQSFSYPNYAWHNNILHIVHTNSGLIAWHQFDKDFLDEIFAK